MKKPANYDVIITMVEKSYRQPSMQQTRKPKARKILKQNQSFAQKKQGNYSNKLKL